MRFPHYFLENPFSSGGGGGADASIIQQQADQAAKAQLIGRINNLFDSPEAQAQFAQENADTATALRGQYGTEQQKAYDQQEKSLRFGFANSGNVASPAYATQVGKLSEANQLVGTNTEQAVNRAINNLNASREDSRARAIQAANAGVGESAVQSASSGIKAALENAKAGQMEDIVGNSFNNLATVKMLSDNSSKDSNMLALFQSLRKSPLAPVSQNTTSGRVNPT